MPRNIFIGILTSLTFAIGGLHGADADDLPSIVAKDGAISMPTADFRRDWSHLGSWTVLDEDSGAHGTHDVYAPQETVNVFRSTGEFPDGAVIIKEIRAFKSAQLTTGNVAYAGDPVVWFVMVKDSTKRFEAKNPLWAKGWGWALFEAGDPMKQVAESFEASCEGCHSPAANTDWVFMDGYPTLR